MAHTGISPHELRDWIIAEVRRTLGTPDFRAAFTFIRLPSPDKVGATWWLRTLSEDMLTWNASCLDAFQAAVERAQQTFDLIE